jgi:hypothetical protein
MHSLLLEAVLVDTHQLGEILKYLSFEYNGEDGLLKLRKEYYYIYFVGKRNIHIYVCVCVCVCLRVRVRVWGVVKSGEVSLEWTVSL